MGVSGHLVGPAAFKAVETAARPLSGGFDSHPLPCSHGRSRGQLGHHTPFAVDLRGAGSCSVVLPLHQVVSEGNPIACSGHS